MLSRSSLDSILAKLHQRFVRAVVPALCNRASLAVPSFSKVLFVRLPFRVGAFPLLVFVRRHNVHSVAKYFQFRPCGVALTLCSLDGGCTVRLAFVHGARQWSGHRCPTSRYAANCNARKKKLPAPSSEST